MVCPRESRVNVDELDRRIVRRGGCGDRSRRIEPARSRVLPMLFDPDRSRDEWVELIDPDRSREDVEWLELTDPDRSREWVEVTDPDRSRVFPVSVLTDRSRVEVIEEGREVLDGDRERSPEGGRPI